MLTESLARDDWDVVVVGAGPGGLFAAHHLALGGARVLVFEAGADMRASLCPRVRARQRGQKVRDAEKFRMQCPRCTCLVGLGGAAFHFDTNLGYISSLSRSKLEHGGGASYSGLERALGSFEAASTAVAEVYRNMYRLGLPRPAPAAATAPAPAAFADQFALVDTSPSQAVTVDDALVMVDSLVAEIHATGSRIALESPVSGITRSRCGFTVRVGDGDTPGMSVEAAAVIVAVGKLGLPFVRRHLADLDVAFRAPRQVDVGVRLETDRTALAPLTDSCHNPKLTYLNPADEPVRTFCVCEGGRLMQYQFGDAMVLDGQHCLTTPTSRSNFGILTTVDVPDGMDGTDLALEFARRIVRAGGGRPVVQSVEELRGGSLGAGQPTPTSTLIDATHADLASVIGPERVGDVLGMVDRLNAMYPGLIGPGAVVTAPVIERLFPTIELNEHMESSVPGLYFVGDSSSKIIGVTYGAATGIAAARSILAVSPTSVHAVRSGEHV